MKSATQKRPILIPREHGAWGMLLVPLILGLSLAGRWDGKALLLLGAVLSLYLARYPLVLWARAGFGQFPRNGLPTLLFASGLGLSLGAALVFRYGLWLLAPLGMAGILILLVHLLLVRHRQERTVAGEFTGLSALAGIAALSYFQLVPALTFLAFMPLTAQAMAGIFQRSQPLNIRKLGYTLVAHSVVFGLALFTIWS